MTAEKSKIQISQSVALINLIIHNLQTKGNGNFKFSIVTFSVIIVHRFRRFKDKNEISREYICHGVL